MKKKNDCYRVVFAGGGTGGHIYPGIAIADALKTYFREQGKEIEIYWIGNRDGMDQNIVSKNLVSEGGSITAFYGIKCGKLRRYISFKNFVDLFKIVAGFFQARRLLKKLNADFVFSKGGFVSVPPCWAAASLKIPYWTHECDMTPGLATRLNSAKAQKILVSYQDTVKYLKEELRPKTVVTGNPIRPVFYQNNAKKGFEFLGIPEKHEKPVLLVLGGSSGARQINNMVIENLQWLKENFTVVHQTGKAFAQENPQLMVQSQDYKPYDFIYGEMPSVLQSADIILSRAGANSIWECAVCAKPMVLIPLCGNGTRGDQVDNAKFFEDKKCAYVLVGQDATAENLKVKLEQIANPERLREFSGNLREMCKGEMTSKVIAELIYRNSVG